MEINLTCPHFRFVACLGWDVGLFFVQSQVLVGPRQGRSQQAFVDGPELPNGQRSEIHRSGNAKAVHIHQQSAQGTAHHLIIQFHSCNEGAIGGTLRVGKEQTTVVSGNPHVFVTGVDDSPHQHKFVPGFVGAGIKHFFGRVRQVAGVLFQ